MRGLCAVVVLVAQAKVAWGQAVPAPGAGSGQPARPGDGPTHGAGSGSDRRGDSTPPAPPPTPVPVAPPAVAPPVAPALPQAPPGPAQQRGMAVGVGVGAWFLTLERVDEQQWETVSLPALTLQMRRLSPLSRNVATEVVTAVVIQDFEVIGDGYQWYGEDSGEEGGGDQLAKFLVLWPGLVLMPFAGSNLHTGAGVVGYFSDDLPSAYVVGGGHMAIYLRPSEDDFIFDIGFGLYGGLGVDLSRTFGFDVRTYWAPPFFHALNDSPETKNFTAVLTMHWYVKERKKKTWLF